VGGGVKGCRLSQNDMVLIAGGTSVGLAPSAWQLAAYFIATSDLSLRYGRYHSEPPCCTCTSCSHGMVHHPLDDANQPCTVLSARQAHGSSHRTSGQLAPVAHSLLAALPPRLLLDDLEKQGGGGSGSDEEAPRLVTPQVRC
jgi:hypothetical protein